MDENLYSRQLGVFGHEAMGKLVKMEVLIVGLRGLGVETAKNLILAGPKAVTLYDTTPTTMLDVGCNFYLTANDIGTPRAQACVAALAELNTYVNVTAAPALTEELVKRHHVVVFTDTDRAQLLRWNAFCRAQTPSISFIAADVMGVAAYAFLDYGIDHVIRDPNGEAPKNMIVTGIEQGVNPTVYTHDQRRHGFEEGQHVAFREVDGMTEINATHPASAGKPRKILSTKPYSFVIEGDTSSFAPYAEGGIVDEVKVPFTVSYASLADRIPVPVPADDPTGMFITPDFGKFGRPDQLHVAFAAVEAWREAHGGALPELRNQAHADEVVALANTFTESLKTREGALQVEKVDEAVVKAVALLARTELPAMATFYGGIVAQEVVKMTGKFTPLRQWLYFDAIDVLPEDCLSGAWPVEEWTPSGRSRYDNVTAIFGRTFQAKVASQRVFVVGAGALGCEFLKDYAMMGLATAPTGRLTVTDMDRIEVSNLNRQFLFRSWNVGQPKSATAGAAARAMNPDLKVEALEVPVGEDTEETFNDAFWEGLDFVTNALDNVKARQYMDHRCVFYVKPLLESGTLGTKANTQVVQPYKTETYTDSQDPPEESIPMCTLRNFPYAIEHCIEWARDIFTGAFTNSVQDAVSFLKSPQEWILQVGSEVHSATRRAKLEGTKAVLDAALVADFTACVTAARHLFEAHYHSTIRQLLHNFPVDFVVEETGLKFWSGPKRPPTAAVFDASNPQHLAFVYHAAVLYASNYGVEAPKIDDVADLARILGPVLTAVEPTIPAFAPKAVKIKTDEREPAPSGGEDDEDVAAALTAELNVIGAEVAAGSSRFAALNLSPAEFEKDDDSNHHIDFITEASNLRAWNYKIKPASRYDVKMTAGRIIPAIATTTCMVTGLVMLEAYKVMGGKPLEALRNSFVNLANNIYSFGEPGGPKRTKSVACDPVTQGPVRAMPEGFTRWEKTVIRNLDAAGAVVEPTPQQIVDWFASELKLDVSMITVGKTILYAPFMYRSHVPRGSRPLHAVVEECALGGKPCPRAYVMLEVSASDDAGDVVIPPVQVYWK